ncbi:glycoside hydrolase family 95 protein [Lachnospiraceae bacterium]|nr:glycoside hydrolase family 95 protein [Lachnospiraceae bacterium]
MNKIFYKDFAKEWMEALPLGNGRLGAMVYGEPFEGRIQLNEESVVYGGPINRINPDARKNIVKIRSLIKEDRIEEAEELGVYALSGTPQSQRPFQTLGQFSYRISNSGSEVMGYRRELDLETGTVSVSYMQDEIAYTIKAFISKEADVLAVEFSTDRGGGLSMSGLLTRGRYYNCAGSAGKDTIYMDGDLGKGGSEFCVQAKACVQGGSIRTIGEHLVIKNADRIVIYLNGVTTYPLRDKKIANCYKHLQQQLSGLDLESFDEVRESHIRRHKEIFGRSVLELEAGNPELEAIPTNERLRRIADGGIDRGMVSLYYAYGRYLLMSCSQPGGLPANLQGIWCEKLEPIWDSKYTININTQMNYWPAEICNLSECHMPLFDHLERMMENGRRTATEMYGCCGFVAHHNTDVWADTAPQDLAIPASYWVMGGAWLATHIWQHYRYTMDQDFLERMYPVLYECVLFFADFLMEDKGELVICPSVSPENTYIMKNGKTGRICMSSVMDTAILRDILIQFLESEKILGKKSELSGQAAVILEKLPGFGIGRHGQLMEWREDYDEWEIGHRHFSHLYPIFPSNQINQYENQDFLEAGKKSLERRMEYGGGHTGWSCAWLVNLYARFGDGNSAVKYIYHLLGKLTAPNLFDLHPPLERIPGIPWVFQIDGNLGGVCGIAQMLLQSHLGEICFLPALPSSWGEGSVKGLCAEGGFEVDIRWQEGRLREAVLHARKGGRVVIRCSENLKVSKEGEDVQVCRDKKGRYIWETCAGGIYRLDSCG